MPSRTLITSTVPSAAAAALGTLSQVQTNAWRVETSNQDLLTKGDINYEHGHVP